MRTIIIIILCLVVFSCEKISSPPVAVIECYPSRGDSTTLFELNAQASTDDVSSNPALKFRWDIDGDGIWDTNFGHDPILVRYYKKPSTYSISVQVMDEDGQISIATDSIVVFGRNKDVSILTDPRDGQTYRIVKIEDCWWMAENLRIGTTIDHWTQHQEENQTIENYLLWNNSRNKAYHTYTWYEAMDHKPNNPKGICPEGWHLPTKKEWESLVDDIPWFYANEYYGENGLSGLNLNDGSYFTINRRDSVVRNNSYNPLFWSSFHIFDQGVFYAGSFGFGHGVTGFERISEQYLDFYDTTQWLNVVRCLKDK